MALTAAGQEAKRTDVWLGSGLGPLEPCRPEWTGAEWLEGRKSSEVAPPSLPPQHHTTPRRRAAATDCQSSECIVPPRTARLGTARAVGQGKAAHPADVTDCPVSLSGAPSVSSD